jgi:hypothetical protein
MVKTAIMHRWSITGMAAGGCHIKPPKVARGTCCPSPGHRAGASWCSAGTAQQTSADTNEPKRLALDPRPRSSSAAAWWPRQDIGANERLLARDFGFPARNIALSAATSSEAGSTRPRRIHHPSYCWWSCWFSSCSSCSWRLTAWQERARLTAPPRRRHGKSRRRQVRSRASPRSLRPINC